MSEKGKIKNHILEGTLSLTIATVMVKLLGAIYKIPLSHILGEEGMGYFNSAYTIYSFFYLLCTAGVPKAIMILVGNARNESDKQKESVVVKTGLLFFGVIGILITLIFVICSGALSIAIGSKNSYRSMLAIAPSILFVSIAGVLRGYLSADQKFLHIGVSQVVEGIGRLVFGLLFAYIADKLCMPLNTVSAFTIFGATLGSFIGTLYLIFNSKDLIGYNKIKQFDYTNAKSVIKSMLRISMPITISAAIMSITNMIDLSLIMRRLLSLGYSESEATALYGNYTTYATPIFNMVLSLFTSVTIVFLPELIKNNNDRIKISRVIEQEMSLTLFFAIPITFGTCLYSYQLLHLLFGNDGTKIGSRLLTYLSFSLIFAIPLIIFNSALEAVGEIKAPMISMLAGSVVKVVISYILIGNSNFGIIGAPLGTVCSYAVALMVTTSVLKKKIHPSISLYKALVLPSVNAFISIGGVFVVYLRFCNSDDHIAFIFAVLITIILYFTISRVTNTKIAYTLPKKQNAQRNA